MGWNDGEIKSKKGNMSSKILLVMIACILLIIVLILIMLSTKSTSTESFKIYVDGAKKDVKPEVLLSAVDDITYVNIEEFSKLVGYEYHKGEYKAATIDETKCYVESKNETSSFYLNENKIYKLEVSKQTEQYAEYDLENPIKKIDEKMYIPLDGIAKAYNVLVDIPDGKSELQIYTLDYLATLYDTYVQNWGYESIKNQSFENQKALLYGYLIVKKQGDESNGLYKIIDTNNTKEIVLDRYTSIEFSESNEEFYVTDSSNKVGVVDANGFTKIEPLYDSILLIDKNSSLYMVGLNGKYGVVSGKGASVIYPEYDSIGISNIATENKYVILNELIPVYKEKKWGAFNKNGKLVLNIEYDELGYASTSVTINGVKELVKPLIAIERANGIVVKQNGKYGLVDINGKELVPIAVDAIYEVNGAENENSRYFMLYNGEELNVIQRLIRAGLIKEEVKEPEEEKKDENEIENNITNSNNISE